MTGLPFDFPKTESRYLAQARRAAYAVRRRFGSGVPATDMVHDVMVEAIAEQARTGVSPKGFWRRLVNKVFDDYRRQRVHQRMIGRRAAALHDAERRGVGAEAGQDEAIGREFHELVERAVAELSTRDQELWRRLGGSQTYAEIAAELGKSAEAVKQAAYRIRAHVRTRIPLEFTREATGNG